ncbi:hypothetical protein [Conexibacter sp. DBS9H8]|uniref:hypothetical protein n=1 Tax=Conexibacter sp. DBS9H8 TaxID=2937801 RepID=UPI00200CEF58|nr:hypothetical protein [Conexibacter sp. DBS9H8]
MRSPATVLVRGSVLLMMLALPLGALLTGAAGLVPFLAMPLVVLGMPLVVRGPEADGDGGAEGDGDDGDGGPGGNMRPDRGPMTPSGPTGTLPLEHSTPGGWRLRSPAPQRVSDPGPRRTPHRPAPATPRRVPAGPHR